MVSPIGCLTTLNNTEYVETWIRCFEVLARVKKLRDRQSEGEQNEITDMFLSTAGCKAIQRVSMMAYPRNLEELTFKEISKAIKRNIRPKKRLVIMKITQFLETRQHPDESIVQFIHQLKERARYCKFEKLGTGEITALNIPMGLLRWYHLPFGIKTTSHVFQRAIEKILLGKVDDIIIYQDNICLEARTREELKSKVEQVLQRLKQAGMTINRDKWKLNCKNILSSISNI